MIEAERARGELLRLIAEKQRQIRFEAHVSKPSAIKLRTLENELTRLRTKLNLLQGLIRDVKELEVTVSLKMMTRYPANQPYRAEYKRDLTRTRRRLKDLAARYQPKPKLKPSVYA